LGFSVCIPAERLQVFLQDRDPFLLGAFIKTYQYSLGKHDGQRWTGKAVVMLEISGDIRGDNLIITFF
jgi:hypothetical protein